MSEKGWWEAKDSPKAESSLIFPPDSFEGYSSTEDEEGFWKRNDWIGYVLGAFLLIMQVLFEFF
jgi:hypothetical protein